MKGIAALVLLLLPLGAGAREFAACVSDIRQQAQALGVSSSVLDRTLKGIAPDERVIRLDRHQPERVLSLDEYLQRVLKSSRLRRGMALLRELEQQGAHHAVENELLVALWGIETDFGRVTGHFDVTRSLLTLACDERRPDFFRRELLALLQLFERGQFDTSTVEGSWAGAMGYLQFLPSVVQRHGRDLDGDGRVTIDSDHEELFSTAADFLVESGWRRDQPWGVELATPVAGCEPGQSCRFEEAATWQHLGWRDGHGKSLAPFEGPARVIWFAGSPTRAFVLFPNFEALLRWNRSDKYAIAVGLFIDHLRAER